MTTPTCKQELNQINTGAKLQRNGLCEKALNLMLPEDEQCALIKLTISEKSQVEEAKKWSSAFCRHMSRAT